jgi:UDP-N-acetylmuramate--alanine ligase
MKHAIRHVHFVGIGGVGMCGIAEVLLNLGYGVSGSDLGAGAATKRLAAQGARIHAGDVLREVACDVLVAPPRR